MLEVPDGFISQLWSKEGVELGQNCNQPEEVPANGTGHQHGDPDSPDGTLRDEAGSPGSRRSPRTRASR